MQKKIINNLCKCPYCFGKFSTEAVQFKSMTHYTDANIKQFESQPFTYEQLEEKRAYKEKQDERYENFWKMYPGSKPQFDYEKFPVLSTRELVLGKENYITAAGVNRDQEGFLYQATDREGKVTKARICPHCHNPLPYEYGKYPVKYIAVVGITSSGKTVYLSQIFSIIDKILIKADFTLLGKPKELEDFVLNHKIEKGEKLPSGNPPHFLTLPIALNVIHNKTKQKYTIIFYDVAGENCVKANTINKFGKFIENANGIILIVDPGQFDEIFDLEEEKIPDHEQEDIEDPEAVVGAMYDAFVAANGTKGKSKIPLAVALSKSDRLKECIEDSSSVIFRHINYSEYETLGFAKEEFLEIDSKIRELLTNTRSEQGIVFENNLKHCFEEYGYFAFSALNTKPLKVQEGDKKYFILNEYPEMVRIEESLLWIFYQLGMITEAKRKKGRKKDFSFFQGGKR